MARPQRAQINASPGVANLEEIEGLLQASTIAPSLRHLVKLRVSQINGCAFCVGMHTDEARDDGESNERLDKLVVWRHVRCYTAPEMAALDWAEALTTRGGGADLDSLHTTLEAHFGSEEIAALTMIVVMINSWNRLQIAVHNTTF